MKIEVQFINILLLLILLPFSVITQEERDPCLWLEDIEGEKALQWVKTQNEATMKVLTAYPEYQKIYDKILQILNSADRIPTPDIKGEYIYNFRQDKKNERGVWRALPLHSTRNCTMPSSAPPRFWT